MNPSVPTSAPESDEQAQASALLASLDRLWDGRCRDCSRPYCGHEALFSIALGFKDAPRCLPCLARGLRREPGELREQLINYVRRRDCYRQAWDYASDREGRPRGFHPACVGNGESKGDDGRASATPEPRPPEEAAMQPEEPAIAAEWDAGDMGCGDLVLALRGRMNALPPGAVLKVTARDPAAPEDLPSWCRLTGHRLLKAQHPDYFIQRKEP